MRAWWGSRQSVDELKMHARNGGRGNGHGWTTAMSAEPPMPMPLSPTAHARKPPILKRYVWDGTTWVEAE